MLRWFRGVALATVLLGATAGAALADSPDCAAARANFQGNSGSALSVYIQQQGAAGHLTADQEDTDLEATGQIASALAQSRVAGCGDESLDSGAVDRIDGLVAALQALVVGQLH
jgi:hypothetical protein